MASPPFFLGVFLVSLVLMSSIPGGAPDLAADGAALLALRAAVGRFVLPWNASDSPCTWQGVACGSGRVTALRLPAVGLIGSIPAGTVGNLSELRVLSLRYNALSGALPPDLPALSELRNLYLQQNRFSGGIPPALGSLKNLVRLNLAGNQFSDGIPPELNNLTRLRTLYLETNRLAGEIPRFDLSNLVQFNVSFNQLNGSIPSSLRGFPAIAFLATGLCGGPLGPCPGEIAPSPAANSPSGQGPVAHVPVGGNAGGAAGNHEKKLSGGAIAGIVIGAAVFLLILLILLILLCRRSGKSKTSSLEAVEARGKQSEASAASERDKGLGEAAGGNVQSAAPAAATGAEKLVFFNGRAAPFDLEDLLRASAEVLGKGTFGTAYKAVLEMGTTLAVKRLRDVALTEREFREKVEVIGAMDHPNLVPPRAYFYSKDEKLLVYDYMPLGSLSALLHGNRGSSRTPLNLETRTGIALAAARGIEYIHSTGPSASHGNIKSSNILLTKSYQGRVSDHGLALLAGPISPPPRVAGYRAPEVTDPCNVSQKADVYSFGVLLLELLTGKAPAQALLLDDQGVDLPRWVQSIVRDEWAAEVFDLELLRYQNVEEEMVQLLQLAINCAAQSPDMRPSMPEVVVRIEEIRSLSRRAVHQEQQDNANGFKDGDDSSSRRTDSIIES
ncbi:hypothetical protein BHE74_00010241 [Ensete ventricosum]|nr:hypothetical protein BHE74_00010241 [Ensete ventricosum]